MPDFKPWQWVTLIALLITLNVVVLGGLVVVVVTYDLWAGSGYLAAEPTVPPWATPTATQRPTFTPTATPETWPTSTPTRTPTRTPSPTVTWTPLPTRTPLPTDTPTPDRPPTDTPTPTATRTRVPTRTPMPTFTATWTPTAYRPLTDTPTATATHTPLPTLMPTPQPTATQIPPPTDTPSPSATSLPMSTPTPQVQPSPTYSDVPVIAGAPATITPGVTLRPSPSSTHTPTATPSPTVTYTPSPSPTATPTPSPSPTLTATSTASPTATATPSPSPTATAIPSPSPTASNIPSPASEARLVEATPLGEDNINLAWQPIPKAIAYRVYSDMGTGLGVYIFKAETRQPTLTDTGLRAGSGYRYRVQSVTSAGEIALDIAAALTLTRNDSQGGGRHVALTSAAPQVVSEPTPQELRVTPAPTPLPPDTVILGLLSASDHADDVENTLTIVGEVRNDSHLDIGQTTVAATFYATDGQVIGEVSGSTLLATLAPGTRSPFMITLPYPTGLANYSLRATGRPVLGVIDRPELSVLNTRRFEDAAGFYHVAGVIENRSQQRIEHGRVIVTLYDRGGRVINVGFAYPQPSALSPRDRADFDVSFTYYPKVFSHSAIAAAD